MKPTIFWRSLMSVVRIVIEAALGRRNEGETVQGDAETRGTKDGYHSTLNSLRQDLPQAIWLRLKLF